MKKIYLLLFLFCVLTKLNAQEKNDFTKTNEKSFPINFNKNNFEEANKLNGEIIAFDGIISEIQNSRNNTPFYNIKLEEGKNLWTVLMFKNRKSKIGDKIRVVGYLREIPTEPSETEKNFLKGKYMVISFGLIDFKKSIFLFLNGAEIQKEEWISGKIPTAN